MNQKKTYTAVYGRMIKMSKECATALNNRKISAAAHNLKAELTKGRVTTPNQKIATSEHNLKAELTK